MNLQEQIMEDSKHPLDYKAELIESIDRMQDERWERMRTIHRQNHVSISLRHFFMKREIELIRSQKIRRQALMNSFYEAINTNPAG